MKVILLQDIKNIGKYGQVKDVKDGYARNLLIPKGMAKEATESNLQDLKRQKEILATKEAEEFKSAQELEKKIGLLKINVKTKGGEGGRLFGSITSKDIAENLMEQHKIEIDKRKIALDNPIKQTGEHTVEVKLHPEIIAKLKVVVEV
ncbi:MAG: 50S ribosomal protein L9 [Anaerovoracaceae bacterium]|jgi:large subunit ribosomal protein L9